MHEKVQKTNNEQMCCIFGVQLIKVRVPIHLKYGVISVGGIFSSLLLIRKGYNFFLA